MEYDGTRERSTTKVCEGTWERGVTWRGWGISGRLLAGEGTAKEQRSGSAPF